MSWPGGLTEEEALQRLQSLAIGAVDGVRDLSSDRDFKALRRVLVGHPDFRDVVPSFVRSQRDLNMLGNHLKSVGNPREVRREYVWAAFAPLLDRARGITQRPAAAARWTGRRTVGEQARVVIALAPVAFEAVEMLLDEQERPLGNGGPVDAERLQGIKRLRELHQELGELISLAHSGKPLAEQLKRVRSLRNNALRWSKETYDLLLYKTPLSASSAVIGSAAWFLINQVTKDIESSATMAGVVAAGHVADVVSKRQKVRDA